ncbi:hypothetical protein LCGC14_2582780 [marine sediment metagenome]|uniref:Peripheral subunit-binding (PSBD) domain-containing protein n=1 Tax=marine sediment metagenome TaxID=412755 RepID=A0A0F9B1Y2_9ZZZZ
MMEVKEWMALENDTGHPTIVLTDPKSGEILAKPRISVFSKHAVGPVNLLAPLGSKDASELEHKFEAQINAERTTIEELYEAALEIDDDAPEPALLDSDAFEDAYLPAMPAYDMPEETEPAEIPPPAPTVKIVKEPEPPVIQATEAAVKLAEENGLDLATIEGSGAEGAIIKSDVEAALKAEAEAEAEEKAEAEKADASSSEGRNHG